MGVTDLIFELNYFKNKYTMIAATAVRGKFFKTPNSLVIVLFKLL